MSTSLASLTRKGSRTTLLFGLASTAALAVAGWFAPTVVLRGWLVAFASLAGLALGCVAWLAIHTLTGGRWGDAARPVLLAGATTLPVASILVLPLIVADHWLYPWAADTLAAGPGVAADYLNTGFLAARSLVLLVGLSVVAWRARVAPLGVRMAALALLLYGGLMTLSAFDWLLSLDPRYTSSAFGLQVIVAQLLSALCLVVLADDAPADDGVWGDYGGLILACLLGEAYLLLMTLVVHWYGNLPDQAAWYLRRSHGAWRWLEVGGMLIGAIGPGCALLFGRVRTSRGGLRIVAIAILAGLVAENIWLVLPGLGEEAVSALLAAGVALVAVGSLMRGAAGHLSSGPVSAREVPGGR